MKIVITGSLGNIGTPLSKQLVKNAHSVNIISSNAVKRAEIEKLGAIPAIGSLEDVAFLKKSFTDAEAVFCMIPPNYAHPDQMAYYRGLGENYKKAIKASGVKRVVHLSSYGAHLPSGTGFISGSYHTEQILNTINGIQLTHVRPTSFYYNLLPMIPMIKKAGFIGAVYGGGDKMTMVSPLDIADAVAEELIKIGSIDDVRYVASDDRTCNEYAAVLGKAIGMPDLKWITLPKEDVHKRLTSNGLTQEYANKLVELSDAIHTGKLREHYDLHIPELGRVKIEDYAEEFAQVFHAK